mmetsp:Transcript_50429/g.58869  ORF Transcript_50429/g.58869 Transcript_50429/m.58869 type:complete len:112 (-) Transcript_50429:274-609(-)
MKFKLLTKALYFLIKTLLDVLNNRRFFFGVCSILNVSSSPSTSLMLPPYTKRNRVLCENEHGFPLLDYIQWGTFLFLRQKDLEHHLVLSKCLFPFNSETSHHHTTFFLGVV